MIRLFILLPAEVVIVVVACQLTWCDFFALSFSVELHRNERYGTIHRVGSVRCTTISRYIWRITYRTTDNRTMA